MSMTFTRDADIGGTSLKGYVTARFSHIVAAFGAPIDEADGYKVSTEWNIKFSDGLVATIYDYKDTNLYDSSLPIVEDFRDLADKGEGYEWHIGGRDSVVVDRIKAILVSVSAPPVVLTKEESLQEVGRNQAECIIEMVAALECDYERLAELRDFLDSEGLMNPEARKELHELQVAAGECTSREEAEERIRESSLEVSMRGDWYSYGTEPADAAKPVEAFILLGTGGPATRIMCELRDGEVHRAWLEVQDWGTPWTHYYKTIDADTLETFARCFYFGES